MRNSPWAAGAGVVAVLAVGGVCGEGSSSPGYNPTIASVDLSPNFNSVEVDRSRPLTAVLRDPQGFLIAPCLGLPYVGGTRVNASSSDSGVAMVLPIGCLTQDAYRAMVIARSIGTVTITAVAKDKKATSTINVNQAPSRFAAPLLYRGWVLSPVGSVREDLALIRAARSCRLDGPDAGLS